MQALIILIGPNRLVWNADLISNSVVSSIGPVIPIPALFIRISILFYFLTINSTDFIIY